MFYEEITEDSSKDDSGGVEYTSHRRKARGVGTYTKGLYTASMWVNGKAVITREYDAWRHMLQRGYCLKYKLRNPSYSDTTIEAVFHDFQGFCLWGRNKVGFGLQGYCLDKDILVKGNKVYGPGHCVFVPQEINKLFTRREARRGSFPIGVSMTDSGKYMARLCTGAGSEKYLGSFKTPLAAFEAYKVAKERYIKAVADHWIDSVDAETHQALYNYRVEIGD